VETKNCRTKGKKCRTKGKKEGGDSEKKRHINGQMIGEMRTRKQRISP
jgi:hypothetical protein